MEEKNGFALVVGVLCYRHGNIIRRDSLASEFRCHLEKSLISRVSACLLGSELLRFGYGRAVVHKASTAEPSAPAKLLYISLVLFGGSRSELVIDVNRVECQLQFFFKPAKHVKKAHRIGTSGKAQYDVHSFCNEIVFCDGFQNFVLQIVLNLVL